MTTLSLPQIAPTPAAAAAYPMADSPEWRADLGRGIRAALASAGPVPEYLRAAMRELRRALGPTALYDVAAPGTASNPKLAKNAAATLSYTGAQYIASGRYNTCPAASWGCTALCVLGEECGHARIERAAGLRSIMDARARRTIALREHPVAAGVEFVRAAARLARLARAGGWRAVARLNVGTDLAWEAIPAVADTLERFRIEAYAYTKRPAAVRAAMRDGDGRTGGTRIVYSWSERADERLAADFLRAGGTVAVVFAGLGSGRHARPVPTSFAIDGETFPTIDGDATDDRTTDPPGHIVGLRGKGPLATRDPRKLATADAAGFAVRPDDPRIG